MPKKASKRKRVSVVSAPGEGAGQPSSQKRMRRGEQVIEETVRVRVPASSAKIGEEQAEDEENGRAGEEEYVVVSQTTRETTRKNTAGRSAGRTATTLKDKQDTGINVDLGRVNNALQGIAPDVTTHHQNASPAPGPTYDVYDLYDYDAELNIRSKVDRLLENDVNHLVQKSSIVEGACTAITALATQVDDLRKSQKSLDGKFARALKSIEASEIRPELKQDLRRKLKGEVSEASQTIGDSLLRVERAMMEVIKGVAGAKKWVGKVSKERESRVEKAGKEEGSRVEVEEVGYVEMAHRKGNSARRPGPPKGSKPKFFDLLASSEEKAKNLKKTDDYYALLNRSIMEKEREIRRTRAGHSGKRHALPQRYGQTPRRAEEVRSERTSEAKKEREDWCEWQESESGEEKVREDSPEVNVKDEEVLEDEEYEDEVNENSPLRDFKTLPAPAPLSCRRLGDGIASAAAPTKALAPVRLELDASTERVTIPTFGPRAHTPPLHQSSNNDDEWVHQQVEVLFNGMRLFGRMGPQKWAQAVKDWDETGGKGKGRAGEGNAGGKRALRGKSVKEIERKWMEMAIGFVEMNAVGEWMGGIL
ncbi:hypothetical protein BGX38DRAFT_579593 [Terfezia claveryi]|nr:hypothetical protein BGX38DRAFT_579593 [Terfezia claveryi]